MSDVSAVLLTIGEPYTERALASIRTQLLPAADVIVIRDLSPMHRALNVGASQVRTPFFVQVDADMILDPSCIRDLRACIAPGVGIVVGHLQDPVFGRTVGIKLFRTACFEEVRFRDSISPDTDFADGVAEHGWMTVYALKYASDAVPVPHAFGEHRPEYAPLYLFSKFRLIGARYRYRRAGGALRGMFRQLRDLPHDVAELTTIATAHGIFLRAEHDLLVPYAPTPELDRVQRFLSHDHGAATVAPWAADAVSPDLWQAFACGYAAGIHWHQQHAATAFLHRMRALQRERAIAAWVTLIGLCHGIFLDAYDEPVAADAFAWLRVLLPA